MATTLIRMMKKASSSPLITLADRITPHRNYTSAPSKTITTTISTRNRNLSSHAYRATLAPTHHQNFSDLANRKSNSDESFLSAIDSEINSAEEKCHEVYEAPRDFPFRLEDSTDGRIVKLTREYQGEEIEVTPALFGCHSEDNLSLNVRVSKKSGLTMKFDVVADKHGITIQRLVLWNANPSDDYIAYKDPDFINVDLDLQKAFYTYLEVRGIEPSIAKFLYDCMEKKTHKHETAWFKNLKNFVSN